jgi:hypothetical protein
MEEYIDFFRDIDAFIENEVSKTRSLELCVVGYAALAFAGQKPARGTKDVDALRTETLLNNKNIKLVESLEREFGKKSPGLYRHGMYLDFVSTSIIWLPPKPKFKDVIKFKSVVVKALAPADVCISKVFSYSNSQVRRSNDKTDIVNALECEIVSFECFVKRLDEALPRYEMHAEAPTTFPKVLKLIEELTPNYGPSVSLKYELPNWMLNMQS